MDIALAAFDVMRLYADTVKESSLPSATDYIKPEWIKLPFDELRSGPGDPCRRHQREGAHRLMANHAAGHRLRKMQWLLVGMQHLLSGWGY